jgi:hypothetical protein
LFSLSIHPLVIAMEKTGSQSDIHGDLHDFAIISPNDLPNDVPCFTMI